MRARRSNSWQDDVELILLETELRELHDDVLNTLQLMVEGFLEQGLELHAEFIVENFIQPMAEMKYHRVLVNVRKFNRQYNNFQTYSLLFVESLRRLARYKMRLNKARRGRRG
ncbi:MAG: hypothetical protein OXL37_04760 [Chloroflexota bacterium]|nr:hypothetical protein [Chloroflexota bacterium]MDE2961023.1 hypothetical protein [Chloroflexota bacterium]